MRYIRIQQITDDHESKLVGVIKDEDIVEEFFNVDRGHIEKYVMDNLLNQMEITDYDVTTPMEPIYGITIEVYEAGVEEHDKLYYVFHLWEPVPDIVENEDE